MATLGVHMDDALLERIAGAAQERDEDTEQLVVEVLTQAFPSKAPDDEDNGTFADEILELLAPFWAEQDRQEAGSEPPCPKGAPGDAVEEYLSKHWADDIRKSSMNR